MKKRWSFAAFAVFMAVTTAIPVFAAKDSDATTDAYIGYSQQSSSYVRGKAYASSANSKFKSINVTGTFYQGSTKKESGSSSATKKGYEAAWYTKDSTYSSSNSYSLNAASRTYYTDGTSSDQSYASASW